MKIITAIITTFCLLCIGMTPSTAETAEYDGGTRLWDVMTQYKPTYEENSDSNTKEEKDLQYWESELNDQSIEEIQRNHIIQKSYKKAKDLDKSEEHSADVNAMGISEEKNYIQEIIHSQRKHKKETYWETDLKNQTIEHIQDHQTIEDSFIEAKTLDLSTQTAAESKGKESSNKEKQLTKTMGTLTADEIILQTIKPEFRDAKIDLDFDETNIDDILLTIGETASLNIVLDPALKNNKLDFKLKNVSIQEALLLIANAYNLGFKKVGKSLFITQKENLRDQNLTSKIIKVRNVDVDEAKLLVENVVQSVNSSKELNSLLVFGSPEEILKVEEIIASIDNPQPQVILEAKIIEVNKDALKDFGIDWSDQINLSYQESGRPVDFDDQEDAPDSPGKIFGIARNPLQFETVIKMLENQNKAKVLSNPRVTTMNDQEAEIFVGDRIPYTITNVTGGVVTTDVRWVEPGIRLTITPSIIGENSVVIKVEPEVSFIFAFRGPNDEFPQVKTREATAHVRIKNKQPFVLGGLLNQEDKRNLFKVPIVGDIPLIGNLFSYEKHTVLDTELIITVVPTIVRDVE